MAVKYVKDFSFPASGGFHGGVQRFAKGGHVTKVPAKAKASAKDMPARAKPNAPAKGAPKMKSEPAKGKRQGYNEGGRVPGYDMDRLPANKPPGRTMDLARSKPFKGAYEGYADGGEIIAPMRPDDGIVYETLRPSDYMDHRESAMPTGEDEMLPTPIERSPEQMRSGPEMFQWSDGTYHFRPELTGQRTPLANLPSHYRRLSEEALAKLSLPEEPNYNDQRYIGPGQLISVERDVFGPGDGTSARLNRGPAPIDLPAPQPNPLARAARMAARREMMGDRGEMGRRFARRTVMPTEITGRMPAPYMPTYTPPTREESDAYLKAAGIVPSIEARFAKGGKVQKVMREYKEGKLHSGSKKGPLVKNREQAVAIALSEARKAGAKIPKKGEGGIFNDESMAYQSKGPKTRYTPAKRRREARERDMDRRALDKARHAEKFAPGLSLDMRAKGGMMKGKKFPDLTGDGKVTRADILKGRGVIKDRKMPTHNRKPMYGKG